MSRLVVVDDEIDVLELLRVILEYEGHKVKITDDPDALAEHYEAGAADAVITDLSMPGHMNGLELIRRLRATDPDLVIVGLTAHFDHGEQVREAGATAFLLKPFLPIKLSRLLTALTNHEPSRIAQLMMETLDDREWVDEGMLD